MIQIKNTFNELLMPRISHRIMNENTVFSPHMRFLHYCGTLNNRAIQACNNITIDEYHNAHVNYHHSTWLDMIYKKISYI